MLQKRRVFDTTNTIINYAFLVFLLFGVLYFCSFWIELKSIFLELIVQITNVFAWTLTIMSVVISVLAVIIIITDHQFSKLRLLWVILRMVLCIIISIMVDVTAMLTSSGISVSI